MRQRSLLLVVLSIVFLVNGLIGVVASSQYLVWHSTFIDIPGLSGSPSLVMAVLSGAMFLIFMLCGVSLLLLRPISTRLFGIGAVFNFAYLIGTIWKPFGSAIFSDIIAGRAGFDQIALLCMIVLSVGFYVAIMIAIYRYLRSYFA